MVVHHAAGMPDRRNSRIGGQTKPVTGHLAQLITQVDFPEGSAWSRVRLGANTTVITEGDRDCKVYLIEEGVLQVVSNMELDGQRRVKPGIYNLEAGEIFGEFCLFQALARTASVVAATDCQLVVVDGPRLKAYMDAHPESGYLILGEMYSALIDRLRLANKRVQQLFAWGLKAHHIDEHL